MRTTGESQNRNGDRARAKVLYHKGKVGGGHMDRFQ